MDRHMATLRADRVQASITSDAAEKSALVDSWRRSASLHRLVPAGRKSPRRLTDIELSVAGQKVEPLLAAAQSSLDRLYLPSAVSAAACCWLIAIVSGSIAVLSRSTGKTRFSGLDLM
ncbi:hypothetical protein EN962_28320 [Mesorhizobium sp. M7A.F.Ca.CA.001.09.2.1]|uniref:Uncharacterized protein n=3 Tax=Mesorhizobium TaxID=68287 RepID=E8TNZ8_MESCW|nr:hypothetical protein Mesci_6458 [Mesorhizobium ciceri biovar biserrulae WSM1271]AMX97541.1 hypothetical protein A4R28_30375 [Mesorhizobium ciceri]RUU34127.1 hypothetical protein EOC83_30275 [Mesorhizobium sp. Primo-A]RUY49466.1 hypothetical protein EN981_16060 [Mesorhizobium sp. M7A.F.Ca.CA.001.13.2.1]RUY69240.1 hypothetical protein EN980_12110 [Mesorhizobium sp. M7A.F.Ca.CA.001.13.1.1]RUY72482.1 hypothetical protein EN962_28320 [Mesorhizobium sp. M7A.F.Ca.CA.001.09.2.1]RUY73535.1 hypothet